MWRLNALTHNEPSGFENCMLTFLINIHQSPRTGGSGLWYAIFWEFFLLLLLLPFFLIQYENTETIH